MSNFFFKVFSVKSFRPLSKQWQRKKCQEVIVVGSRKISSHVLSTNFNSNTKILSKTFKHFKSIQITSQLKYCDEKKNKIITFSDFEKWSVKNKESFLETVTSFFYLTNNLLCHKQIMHMMHKIFVIILDSNL